MTYQELENIAVLLYGSHWKQQIIAEFGGCRGMLGNWKHQGIPDHVHGMLKIIARQRVLDAEKAVRVLESQGVK